ncbi:MAG: 2-amino-4-hydroxy-6-hydroxymethyldihydropteridine diphosphokinase [Opitutaceae bacterium]|jgi:2-amino-4-hydroxy-6-hydroxymethyldihydropteridine diphosphokinase|nr:2-amino-4-hydroxy-6-hydroxymethyldihydropteridine diphosphokinase [Opitutaceae bacterium]
MNAPRQLFIRRLPTRRLLTRQAFISAGANLGDRAGTLRGALAALARTPGIARVESSPLYETAPVDVPDQPAFLNLAAGVETTLSPERLLACLLAIEADFGRVRDPARPRGPRTLDLDLLLYEGEHRAAAAGNGDSNAAGTASLTLPHPRMWRRAFVLVPLRELVKTHVGWMRSADWAAARRRLSRALRTSEIKNQDVSIHEKR